MCAVVRSHGTQGTLLVRPTHMVDTDEVAEGSSNLYFTVARAVSAIKADGDWNASNWDTAYGWGDHDGLYLPIDAVTLPDQTGHAGQFLTTNGTTADWATVDTSQGDTAFSWGDHASAGYLTSHQDISGKADLSGDTFTGNVNAPSFTGRLQGAVTGAPDATIWCVSGQYTDWGIFYDEDTPDLIQFKSAGTTYASIALDNGNITTSGTVTASGGNSTNWNTAYSWGNHASAGYLTSLPSHNHDDRYYTESESDSRFVNVSGDTMTGTLTVPNLTIGSGSKIKFANNDYIRYDDGANRFHFDVDGGTSNGSLQAATFIGALSGNASVWRFCSELS
jgi:hypothetical protein